MRTNEISFGKLLLMRFSTISTLVCFLFFSPTIYSQQDSADLHVFEKVDKEAFYPGGEGGWKQFLVKNLNPNVPIDNGAPVGIYTVYAQFIVNKEGLISDVKALTNIGYGMEKEVLRIIQKSGKWVPANQNGRNVNAYRKQPVTFQVTDESFEISAYTISADKDNEIIINVGRVQPEDIDVTISRGTITRKAGTKYIIHVTGKERVIIKIFNMKKKNKEIGSASLAVM